MVRKKYHKAFKIAAVMQIMDEGKKVSHVAKALGILPTMLSRWVYEYQTHGDEAFTGNGKPIANKELEIKRLQKRLAFFLVKPSSPASSIYTLKTLWSITNIFTSKYFPNHT
ncbi:MAG: transposase [Brevibacillus sp.]|nr:transposase [Brevibacillus sp.]